MYRSLRASCSAFCLAGIISTCAIAAELEVAWEAVGFDTPESALFDGSDSVIYVSNMNGDALDMAGNGYLSKLSASGEVLDQEWVTGLNAPKGMALNNGTLYVSDINRLVAINVASGEIAATYEAAGAKLLNDVTAHEDGRIFVSDMMTNSIHVLEGDAFDVWLQDDDLENPNGLLAEGDRLLVGAWGVMKEDFSTDVPGHLKAIDYATKEITSVGGDEPIGNLDGVEPDGKGGYLITDWMSGSLLRHSGDGSAELLLDINQGSADHEFLEGEGIAVIPMMMDGKVIAYKVD